MTMSSNIAPLPRNAQAQKAERKIKASMPLAEQIATLSELIAHSPTNSRVVEFSSKLAEYVLTKLNLNNRPMKPAKIKKYASDFASGLWMLKDGQNRLSACVRVGQPMISHVVFGIDPQLFARMDIGKNHTGGDVFAIAGISYAGHVAAAVRWLLILTGPDPSDRGAQFSNEDLLKAYREQFNADQPRPCRCIFTSSIKPRPPAPRPLRPPPRLPPD